MPVDVSRIDCKDTFLLPLYAPFCLPKGNHISEIIDNEKVNRYLKLIKKGCPQITDCLKRQKKKQTKPGSILFACGGDEGGRKEFYDGTAIAASGQSRQPGGSERRKAFRGAARPLPT